MIDNFARKTAVLTGAGSGFGLECARIDARLGMNPVLVDVQQDALNAAAAQMQAAGAQVLARKMDVSSAAQLEQLAAEVAQRFSTPHRVFSNAGVGAGSLVWENSAKERNRPGGLAGDKPAKSQRTGQRTGQRINQRINQRIDQAMMDKSVNAGKLTAAEVAQRMFDALAVNQFCIDSHPKAIGAAQTRMQDILQARNPAHPFADKPGLGGATARRIACRLSPSAHRGTRIGAARRLLN